MSGPNKSVVVVVPHSHTWLWTQTCLASLLRCPPQATGFDVSVVVVDNSPWSPSINGVLTMLQMRDSAVPVRVMHNPKSNKFHASALDSVVDGVKFFDYMVALETDVLALRPTWLQWLVDQMRPSDYAVGMWHHEQFINPSCTLYRGSVLRDMMEWSRPGGLYKSDHAAPQDELRWGPEFNLSAPLDNNLPLSENPAAVLLGLKEWIGGPFAEKRGWPAGTVLKEQPSGQLKGPGWYEPGQQLHHWAVERGFTYTVCPTLTTKRGDELPLQSLYGATMPDPLRQLEAVELFGNAETCHLWGGTRALDILKHPVTCNFVKSNTPYWLAREARFWREVVPLGVRGATLDLMRACERRTGSMFHTTGQGSDHVTARDIEAAEFVKSCYQAGGVTW